MSQLRALVWLKWTLFRNSMRSRKAVVSRVAGTLGMLAALALALVVALGLGALAYVFAGPPRGGVTVGQAALDGYLFLLLVFVFVFVMWGLMPLALGGGGSFDAGRLLLYPISLRKLFVFDALSELTSLSSVFAVPTVLAVGAGAGLASGAVGRGLLLALWAAAFGLAFAKMLAVAVGSLMRRKRTRGETVLALFGAAVGLLGAFVGQLMPVFERYAPYLMGARWTPPGAFAYGLSYGLRPGGGGAYVLSLMTLVAYTLGFGFVTYRVARRTALGVEGGGGGKKREAKKEDEGKKAGQYVGWQLPLVSSQFAALFEKELRYALRNAQLRVIAVMAVGLTVVLRMAPVGKNTRGGWGEITQYAEGAGTVMTVIYVFMLISPLSTNLFGYDGAGMRALVLAPLDRRRLLVAKNAAVTLVTGVMVAAGVFAGGLIFRDLSWHTLAFAALSFVIFAALFPLGGNWLSMVYPKRVEFGKRMNRSGLAGFLQIPFFMLLLMPPAVAVLAAHFAQSFVVEYAILAAFAALSVGLYFLLIAPQGRALERRELEILEAVTGRGGDENSKIMG
ncbi:MAG TPA: hypothetical protein VFS10_06940 [Pyrinomonadaceae bacterium]|nr:hypothetical protein [Pyrinomonadaceae bacterium]